MQASTLSVTPKWDHIALDLFRLAPALPKKTEGYDDISWNGHCVDAAGAELGHGRARNGSESCRMPAAAACRRDLAMREAKYGVDLAG